MGRLNTESVQLLLIPKAGCSLAEQTLTLKHTLSKLGMLTARERETVSTAMLRYTQFLGSRENPILLQSILDELTVTEQEALLSLVESAMQLLEKQDLKKSTTPSSFLHISTPYGVGSLGSITPSNLFIDEYSAQIAKNILKTNTLLQQKNKVNISGEDC
jgi:hypothetical protein